MRGQIGQSSSYINNPSPSEWLIGNINIEQSIYHFDSPDIPQWLPENINFAASGSSMLFDVKREVEQPNCFIDSPNDDFIEQYNNAAENMPTESSDAEYICLLPDWLE